VLGGVLFGLFKLTELEHKVLDSQTENIIENDGEVRGSQILDAFISGRSALIVAVDDCGEGEECSDYLSALFINLVGAKKSAPPVLVFDIVMARDRSDTNLGTVLQKLAVKEFPAIILVDGGIETARKEGTVNANDELYGWLVGNGILADEKNAGD